MAVHEHSSTQLQDSLNQVGCSDFRDKHRVKKESHFLRDSQELNIAIHLSHVEEDCKHSRIYSSGAPNEDIVQNHLT